MPSNDLRPAQFGGGGLAMGRTFNRHQLISQASIGVVVSASSIARALLSGRITAPITGLRPPKE
jgi:hypothetical protein